MFFKNERGNKVVRRVVDTKFWTNNDVIDMYTVEDKYFALYLMTNGRSSQIGIYSLPKKIMSFETGFTTEVIEVLLDRFSEKYKKISYCNETQEVTILQSLEYSILKGGKPVLDLLEREINSIKAGELILETYKRMINFWNLSQRKIDKDIRSLFEKELSNRGLRQNHNENQNHNEKQSHNHIHIQSNNQINNQISNQVSCNESSNDKTVDNFVGNDADELEYYIKWLQERNPENADQINRGNVVIHYYGEFIEEPTLEIKQSIINWGELFSEVIIIEAINRSKEAYRPMNYASAILNNWKRKNVKTFNDIINLDNNKS